MDFNIFFSALCGFLIGAWVTPLAIDVFMRSMRRMNLVIERLALEKGYYKKKAGYDIEAENPDELKEILKDVPNK